LLLSNKARHSAINDTQDTPLLVAAAAGHPDVCRLLLAQGAAPDLVPDGTSDTALLRALHAGHGEVAEVLVEAGACIPDRASEMAQKLGVTLARPVASSAGPCDLM
jgi:ankyrin repeat protein